MSEKIKILNKAFGRYWLTNGEYLFACPKCKHHKLKLSINVEKDVYKCWVCDYAGNKISSLIRAHSPQHLSSWAELAGEVDLSQYEDIFANSPTCIQKSLELPHGFKTLTGPQTKLKRKPLEYLYQRGITDLEIVRWKMGFCDFGEYENRIIIPSFDRNGELNYYVSRSYIAGSYKYKNPKVSKDIIFNELCIDWEKEVTLVEGVFDAIKCENSIPLLGSMISESSKLFQKLVVEKPIINLALDSDAKEKQHRISSILKEYDMPAKIIDVFPYNDLGEMSKEEVENRKQKARFIADTDYLKYKLDLL